MQKQVILKLMQDGLVGEQDRQEDSTTWQYLTVSALSASPRSSWSLTSDTSFFLVASSVGQLLSSPKRMADSELSSIWKSYNRYLWVQHFKMKSIYSVRDVLHRGDWMAVGPPGCLSYSAYILLSQEISKVSMESTGIPVPVPSFWVGHGSQSFYKTHEASSDLPQTAGDQTSPVSGRHTVGGRVPRSSQGTLEKGSKPAWGTRFLTQQEEVCLDPNPKNRVLGVRGGFKHHAPRPSTQKGGEDQ